MNDFTVILSALIVIALVLLILYSLRTDRRAVRKTRAVRENRSLIARVRHEADAIEEVKRMREKGRE